MARIKYNGWLTIFLSYISIALVYANQTSSNTRCNATDAHLIKCDFNQSCIYGQLNKVKCKVDEDSNCEGYKEFDITFLCSYCWQLVENVDYNCSQNSTCHFNSRYLSTCETKSDVFCLGSRKFSKYKTCNYANGRRKSVAIALSYLFGGFGIDRFYLGYWQEGIGKLFSFGGFGIWTLIDAILISIGYLKPADVY